jgi:hypothetical protein
MGSASEAQSRVTEKARSAVCVLPIRTELMAQYVRDMQVRLREKKIGYQKEFLREILKEVRIKGNSVTLKYRLPAITRTPPARAKNPGKEEFFTLYQMVEPMGVEPTTSRVRFQSGAILQAPPDDKRQSFQPFVRKLVRTTSAGFRTYTWTKHGQLLQFN